jgi:hypothetical protein
MQAQLRMRAAASPSPRAAPFTPGVVAPRAPHVAAASRGRRLQVGKAGRVRGPPFDGGMRDPSSAPTSPQPPGACHRPGAQATAEPGLLQKLGRVLKEKASGDFERYVKGTTKTRERLGLVEELLTFWSLEDYESTLEELEEGLIVRRRLPATPALAWPGLPACLPACLPAYLPACLPACQGADRRAPTRAPLRARRLPTLAPRRRSRSWT